MSFPLQAMPAIHNGLDALWHHQYKKAEQVFSQLAEQGDAHAMYWLGNTYQLEGGMKRLDAGRILLKAAKMGDPWAMDRLDPENAFSFCSFWPCNSKWRDKALEGWKKLSKQGNGKATFALLLHKENTYWYRFTKWLPGMGQEKLNEMAIKAYNQGYQGASIYLFNNINKPVNKKLETIINAAENKFKPSYKILASYYSNKNNNLANKYLGKSVKIGDLKILNVLFTCYSNGWIYTKDYNKAYYYGKILALYGKDMSPFFQNTGPKEYRLNSRIPVPKQRELIIKAQIYVKNHRPYHYYDEFSQPWGLFRY
ncbi:SEL1-like repeat protein [Celerinatantimonas diazotrophica]|nr:sel1 repeat family protein [Celerinatantimonas diazotrophica]